MKKRKFPIQPIITDEQGIERFKENKVVRKLLDASDLDLNTLIALLPYTKENIQDWEQFYQLIGSSIDSYLDNRFLSSKGRRSLEKKLKHLH